MASGSCCSLMPGRRIDEADGRLPLWVHQWRRRYARGRNVIVRYADDFVMGFENEDDALNMLLALEERLVSFGLALHQGRTRLIEFGRFAALTRQRRGERKPETFAFLGFIHYCGVTRDGRFIVKHKAEGKRLTRKLKALRLPLCCVDTTSTTVGRITIPRLTGSISKHAAYGSAA